MTKARRAPQALHEPTPNLLNDMGAPTFASTGVPLSKGEVSPSGPIPGIRQMEEDALTLEPVLVE